MRHYAQTNIQLFNQLHLAGYGDADLARASSAYTFAAQLFTGCFRPSGRVFLAHLVGTASILSELRRPIDTIVAGLLHSVYTHGEFGDGGRGASANKRAEVRSVIGLEAEKLIAAYTRISWGEISIPMIEQSLGAFDATDREALLIRLANELEDHLDRAALYSGHLEPRRQAINTYLRPCVEYANQLGFPSLSEELAHVFAETLSTDLPEVLRHAGESYKSVHPIFLLDHESSFLVAPASHRPRVIWRFRRSFRRELQVQRFRLKLNLARLKNLPNKIRRRANKGWPQRQTRKREPID